MNENDGIATDQFKVLCEPGPNGWQRTNIARMWREKENLYHSLIRICSQVCAVCILKDSIFLTKPLDRGFFWIYFSAYSYIQNRRGT